MILVTGALVAREGCFDELLRLSLAHVARSRAEPGCLSHAVHRDAENPQRLVFFEEWADEAALKVHFALPASREFVRQAASLSAVAHEIRLFSAHPLPFP